RGSGGTHGRSRPGGGHLLLRRAVPAGVPGGDVAGDLAPQGRGPHRTGGPGSGDHVTTERRLVVPGSGPAQGKWAGPPRFCGYTPPMDEEPPLTGEEQAWLAGLLAEVGPEGADMIAEALGIDLDGP